MQQEATGSEKMTLYWRPLFRSIRVIWLLKELGVEDDVEMILGPRREDSDHGAYTKDIQPHGTIPALVVPGQTTIIESGAICLYLADKYNKLSPNNRIDYYNYILYATATLDPIMVFFFLEWFLKRDQGEDQVKNMLAKVKTALDYLSSKLQGRTFLCGDEFTAADCVLGYNIHAFAYMNKDVLLKDHPRILEYYDLIKDRPAFQATIAMKAL